MTSRKLTHVHAMVLLVPLAIPVALAAQDQQNDRNDDRHYHYRVIDLGTFGGPTSWFCNDLTGGGGACPILNNRGTVVSGADTTDPNPNYLNSNFLLPPFNPPIGDPFIQHAFQWQGASLQDLGVLPGGYNSFAQAVSANGLIAGMSENGLTDPLLNIPAVNAVLWKEGQIFNLGTLEGGYESLANGVNSRGLVVGESLNTVPDPFLGLQVRAFLWQKEAMQDLGTLGTGTDAVAYFVNEPGQIAGASFTNTTINSATGVPTEDPFLWVNGTMYDLGTLGGTLGFPNAINNGGQVIGQSNLAGDSTNHPFLWDKRGNPPLADLGTLGGDNGYASRINDAGAVVGTADLPGSQTHHAFLWQKGVGMTDLGTVGSDPCSGSLGINSRGQVVGFSSTCAVNAHAFLWEDGQITDLNIFNYSGSGLQQLLLAYNINDSGEIAGLGVPPRC